MADETTKPKTADQLTQEAVVLMKASLTGDDAKDDATKDQIAKAVSDVMKPALEQGLKLGDKVNAGFSQEEANALAVAIREAQKNLKEGEALLLAAPSSAPGAGDRVTVEQYVTAVMGVKVRDVASAAVDKGNATDKVLGGEGYDAIAKTALQAELNAAKAASDLKTEQDAIVRTAEFTAKVQAYNASLEKILKDVKPETIESMKGSAGEVVTLANAAMDARIQYAADKAALDEKLKDREDKKLTETEKSDLKAVETRAIEAEKAVNDKFTSARSGFKDNEKAFDAVLHAAIDTDRAKEGQLDKYKSFLKASAGTTLNKEVLKMVQADRFAGAGIETKTSQQLKAAAAQGGKGGGVANLVVNNIAKLAIGTGALTAAAAAFVPNKETVGEDGKPAQKKRGFIKNAVIAVGAVLTLGLAAAAISPESTASIARKVPGGGHVADVLARRAAQAATGAARA